MKKLVVWLLALGLAAAVHEALAVVFLGLSAAVFVIVWLAKNSSLGTSSQTQQLTSKTEPKTPAYVASAPTGSPVEPWAPAGTTRINVVGESRYPAGFIGALEDFRLPLTPEGVELPGVRATLVTDPENPYDTNAVSVWLEGRHLVGYLPAELAAQYASALAELQSEGTYLRVPARAWVAEREGVFGSVSVSMPAPNGILSFNELPERLHCVLPTGKALQVTGEDAHMDVLTKYLNDQARYLAVTLHLVSQAPKSGRGQEREVVEVRLDGNPIGCLTKAMSDSVRDLVAYVSERGMEPVARAVLKGSSIKADVTLYVARSSDVTQQWLDSIARPSADERGAAQ